MVHQAVSRKKLSGHAIKIVTKESLITSGTTYKLFMNEISVVRQLQDHPHLMQVQEILHDANNFYIVCELCSEGDLFDYLRKQYASKQKPSERQIRKFAKQLFLALLKLHSQNIVHRDIKLENILVGRDENDSLTLKLGDFGMAQFIEREYAAVAIEGGSMPYMAPEALSCSYLTSKSDVWSAAVVLFNLFAY